MAARQRGITLVEMVATIIILAIALTAVTAMLSRGLGRSSDVLTETRAVALAQSYLEEIIGRRFDEASNPRGIPPCWYDVPGVELELCAPNPDGDPFPADGDDGSRAEYDDVDDYDDLDEGWNSTGGVSLRDAEGNVRNGYDNFRVRVSVRYVDARTGEEEGNLGLNLSCVDNSGAEPETLPCAKLITVNISHPDNDDGWDFSVYKSNF
ncbi:MAG: type II secretion system protein [Pseudohongiellaceae bacterium]